jgi:DNA topoisomerase VI subunit B
MGPTAADEAASVEGEEIPQLPPEMKPKPTSASGKLPSLDSLLSRMPTTTRSAIDEHLRARFVRVRKLSPGELR